MSEQRYEITLTATGEVHDADGNLISQTPVETTITVTETELLALIEQGETP